MNQHGARTFGSRTARGALALLAPLVLLAACGDDEGSTTTGSDGVTVEGLYGPVTVGETPERIVTLTMSSVDILDSLDLEPVAYALDAFPGEEAGEVPWLPDLDRDTFDENLITAEYTASPEDILAHEPDLIIAASHLVDEATYEQLAQIAPTYVPITGDDRDWTTTLAEIGTLTGQEDASADVQADVDAEFAAAQETLAGLQGATFNYAQWLGTRIQFFPTNWTLEKAGLVPGESAHEEGSRPLQLSLEQVEQLNAEVVVVMANAENAEAMAADPRVADLPASSTGSVLVVEPAVHDASLDGYAGPASVNWALAQFVEVLETSDLAAGTA